MQFVCSHSSILFHHKRFKRERVRVSVFWDFTFVFLSKFAREVSLSLIFFRKILYTKDLSQREGNVFDRGL